jgi:hypothetical protein
MLISCASYSSKRTHLAYNRGMSTPNFQAFSFINSLRGLTFALAACLVLTACSRATPTPEPTPAPLGGSCTLDAASDDESAIRALLAAEGEFVVAQNIDPLMRLWVDDGKVVDAKNTPDASDDDQVWDGKDAIRHRYVRTVFPGAPAVVDHGDETITINGDQAQVESTTTIGSEVAPAGDRWEMVRQANCWYLASLTYNLEPAP